MIVLSVCEHLKNPIILNEEPRQTIAVWTVLKRGQERERENRVQSFDDVFVLEASNKVAHEQVTIFSTPMRIQIMQSSKTLKGAEPPIERINTRELKQMWWKNLFPFEWKTKCIRGPKQDKSGWYSTIYFQFSVIWKLFALCSFVTPTDYTEMIVWYIYQQGGIIRNSCSNLRTTGVEGIMGWRPHKVLIYSWTACCMFFCLYERVHLGDYRS